MPAKKNVLIMGAAGRDFHNFNVCYRNNPLYKVVAFTAFQIPDIEGRTYPRNSRARPIPRESRSSPKRSSRACSRTSRSTRWSSPTATSLTNT